jgi:O-antigen/teichoic acid export membrane protein
MLRRRRTGAAGNTAILTIGTVVQTVIALVTVPLYLSQLGQERFGVWVIAGLVIAYFGLLDRALGTAVQREVAGAGDDDRDRAAIVWTAVVSNFAVGVAVAMGVVLVGEVIFMRFVDVSASLRTEAIETLPILASSVPLVSVMAICQGTLMARGRVASVSALETVRLLGLQLIPLGFVYVYGPDLRWLALGALVALAIATSLYLVAMLVLAIGPVRWSRPSLAIARRLYHYGKWVSVTSILTPVLDFSDRLVVGLVRGASTVTAYSIPYNLTARMTIIPLNVVRVSFPRFSGVSAQESRKMAVTAVAAVAAVTTPAAVFGSIISGPFFAWWLGGDIARESAPVAAILFAGFWVNGMGYVPSVLLQAQGRPDVPARFHTIEAVPFLLVLALGVYIGGAIGGAIAWSCRALVDALLLMIASSLGWRRVEMVVSAVLVTLAACLGALFPWNAAVLAVAGTPLVCLSLAVSWRLLPNEYKEKLLRVVRRKRTGSNRPAGPALGEGSD